MRPLATSDCHHRSDEDVRILALSDYGYGSPGGCLGINCAHTLTPFLSGINEKPDLPPWLENLTPEQAIENENVQAKQRALEREIRRNKERLHVAKKLWNKELENKFKLQGKNLNDSMDSLELFNGIIGLKAKGGVKITELSEHSVERFVERGVSPTGMKQAIKSPLNNLEVKIDEKDKNQLNTLEKQ